ncbi:MAG: fimbria/pilus periplasmic chaperone [Pseudomonadota bacterium]
MNKILPCVATMLMALLSPKVLAGEFSVSPVRLDLGGVARSQLLSITNAGTVPARFLVRGAAWTMTEAGAVELSDDDKLIVFPASFTVAPKASQNIRVGTDQRSGETEKTWRVLLEELPDANAAGSPGATINVLSVISVPVFMPPLKPRKAMEISWLGQEGASARIALVNDGNAHEMVAAVSVTAMRGEDTALQAQQEGWYILPGKRRVYALAGERNWCASGVTRFELRATDRQGETLARRTVDAREACR